MVQYDLWKLSPELSVVHAALLIAGENPADFESFSVDNIVQNAPNFLPVKTAICNAILSGDLNACNISYLDEQSERREIDVYRTFVKTEMLKIFVQSRGVECEFFGGSSGFLEEIQNRAGKYFAFKLSAANRAWAAVTADPSLWAHVTPKQALEKWLRDNATELDLRRSDGTFRLNAIDEISKVANWKPEGGVAPTRTNREQ